jgi:hypothetical protein
VLCKAGESAKFNILCELIKIYQSDKITFAEVTSTVNILILKYCNSRSIRSSTICCRCDVSVVYFRASRLLDKVLPNFPLYLLIPV